MIRRLKSEVLSQLPSKQRQMIILDPAAIKTKSKEMDEQAKLMGKKSLSSGERRSVLLEWFNMTGRAKTKAVLDYVKDGVGGQANSAVSNHHRVSTVTVERFSY